MVIKYNFNIFFTEKVSTKAKRPFGPQKSYYDPVYSEWIFWSRRRGNRSLSWAAPSKTVGLRYALWLCRMVFIHSETVSLFLVELTLGKIMKKIIWGSPVPFPPCLSPPTPYQKRDWDILQIFRSSKKSISIRQHQSGSSQSTWQTGGRGKTEKKCRSKERNYILGYG